jgi:hypothetical protein
MQLVIIITFLYKPPAEVTTESKMALDRPAAGALMTNGDSNGLKHVFFTCTAYALFCPGYFPLYYTVFSFQFFHSPPD